jgi:predicted GNAT family acetyltransferase
VTGARTDDTEPQIFDDPGEERYELWLGDELAGVIEYETRPGAMVLIHTEVDRAYEGKGLGSRLIAWALRDIRSRGLKLYPLCPFVRAYLERHPEDRDLVADEPQAES